MFTLCFPSSEFFNFFLDTPQTHFRCHVFLATEIHWDSIPYSEHPFDSFSPRSDRKFPEKLRKGIDFRKVQRFQNIKGSPYKYFEPYGRLELGCSRRINILNLPC